MRIVLCVVCVCPIVEKNADLYSLRVFFSFARRKTATSTVSFHSTTFHYIRLFRDKRTPELSCAEFTPDAVSLESRLKTGAVCSWANLYRRRDLCHDSFSLSLRCPLERMFIFLCPMSRL